MAFHDALAAAVRARTPSVWRAADLDRLDPDLLFAAVCEAVAGPQDRASARPRIYQDGSACEPILPDLLPNAADGSFAGWLDRVERTRGDTALIVNDFQAASLEMWRAARRVMSPLAEAIGVPAAGASWDLFSGRYARTAFGVHKDDQDVITLVVEGHKRFHLWPFEALAHLPGVTPGLRLRGHGLGDPADLPAPLVLDAAPGDVLYWPAEWWHVAVAADDTLVTTVGIGLFRPTDPLRLVAEAVAAAGEGLPPAPLPALPPSGDLTAAADQLWDDILAWLATPALRAEARPLLLGWASALGFAALPSLPDAAPFTGGTIRRAGPLVWTRADPETLSLGVSGRVIPLPWHPALPELLQALYEDRALSVADVRHQLTTPRREGDVEHTCDPDVADTLVGLLVAMEGVVVDANCTDG